MDTSDAEPDDRANEVDEIERLRRELDLERQRHVRLLADFDNYRRRTMRERESAGREGRRAALLPLLPALDTLELALASGSTDQALYRGIEATHRQFINALREAGADPIESIGMPFDPKVHEVVATIPAEDFEPGNVERETRRGWRLGEDLLRPAQVIVGTGAGLELGDPWR